MEKEKKYNWKELEDFYLDPNLKGGVYTMDNITPKAIKECETIYFKENKI